MDPMQGEGTHCSEGSATLSDLMRQISPLARVVIEDGKLRVLMGTVESYQTRTRRFEVPLRSVTGIDTDRAPTTLAGSHSSGAGFGFGVEFKATSFAPLGGRYNTKEGKLLVAFRDPEKCVAISLKDEQYDKVIVQVDDKDKVADQVRGAIQSSNASSDRA